MALLAFALSHFAIIILLALLSYVLGRRLTWTVPYASAWEEVAFSTGLGLGVLAYLVFFLGLLGLLYPLVVGGVIVVLVALCYPVWRDLARRVPAGLRRARLPLLVLGAALLLLAALSPFWRMPLYPPTTFDAIMYHLPSAKIYVDQHQVVLARYLRFPLAPQTNEMLFTLALLFADDITAQLIQFLMALLVGVALYAWGRRVFSQRAGLWAAGLWLANPLVWWLGSAAYIDLSVTLFACLGVYAFFNWVTTRAQGWLILAAAMCGFAAGSKYTALFFIAALALPALYLGFRERRWRAAILFVVVASCVAAPWYLRNVYYAGNPFEPFFPGIFGYHLWDDTDMNSQLRDWFYKGMGRDPGALLLLPWNLTMHQGLFGNDAPLMPLPFLALPLTIIAAIRRRYLIGLLLISAADLLIWFFSAQIQRYLLPVMPLLILATAVMLDMLVAWVPRLCKGRIPAVLAALGFALCLVPAWFYAAGQVADKGPVPVTAAERNAYLSKELSAYPAHKFLNDRAGSAYRLYALYDEEMAYYADGTFMGNSFGPARFNQVLRGLGAGQWLYKALTNLQADYFLVTNYPHQVQLPEDAFFQDHFKLIYTDKATRLFQIIP